MNLNEWCTQSTTFKLRNDTRMPIFTIMIQYFCNVSAKTR
jgi:hypothetical protein